MGKLNKFSFDRGSGEMRLECEERDYVAYGSMDAETYCVSHAPTQEDFDAVAKYLDELTDAEHAQLFREIIAEANAEKERY